MINLVPSYVLHVSVTGTKPRPDTELYFFYSLSAGILIQKKDSSVTLLFNCCFSRGLRTKIRIKGKLRYCWSLGLIKRERARRIRVGVRVGCTGSMINLVH